MVAVENHRHGIFIAPICRERIGVPVPVLYPVCHLGCFDADEKERQAVKWARTAEKGIIISEIHYRK
jgi:hypothetical protein